MIDEPNPAVTMTSGVRGLIRFARPARTRFLIAGALSAVSALLSLVPFWVIYRTIEELVTGSATRSQLWTLAGIGFVVIIVRFVVFGVSIAVSHVASYEVLYGIRLGLAEHLARVPLGRVTRRRSGEIKKVMGDDVERLELFLAHGIPDVVAAVVTLTAVPIWMFTVDWRMAIAAVGVVVPAFIAMSVAMQRSMRNMNDYHSSLSAMNASVIELVRGMPVVKVFNRGSDRVRDAERAVDDYVDTVKRYSADFLPLGTAFFVLLGANVALIVPLGVWLNESGSLSDVDLLFFFVVGLGALLPVISLLQLFANLNHLTSGGNLVNEILAIPVLDVRTAGSGPADSSVEFDDVTFSYDGPDGRAVLSDVSFLAEPGQITALVGPSGAGKSTVAALVARFWDVEHGAVRVGGADVRDMTPDDLARHVAVVLQDTFLFDDTIAANLRIGKPDASSDELVAAASAAQAHDFIIGFPDGYETVVGERGTSLSGGERQRVTLARAILADAPVILLDEATSFADPENEVLIQDAIGRLVHGKTVIMIAHRLSTVMHADQILVIDGGRVVERGTHTELLSHEALYAHLWGDYTSSESVALGDAVRGGLS